jgi:hypothetical protein
MKCEHEWDGLCSEPCCVEEDCKHKGRMCTKCGVDKHDCFSKDSAP